MKVLVTAFFVSGDAKEGGSSRFMACVHDVLKSMGHDVIRTNNPGNYMDEDFDVIICSHLLAEVLHHPARKICISHGIIRDEVFIDGADRYISISEEILQKQLHGGIASEILGQPIYIREPKRPGDELKNILVIRRESVDYDPFKFLSEKHDLRYSDIDVPIEEQIGWADLCIALGRGALESMAQGKPVLVADNRQYIGAYGDGYVNENNIKEIARCNFSGRRFRYTVNEEWVESELKKYNPDDFEYLHTYVKENHDANNIVRKYLLEPPPVKVSFGVMVNDWHRMDMVFKQSEIEGKANIIKLPESATIGLNKLLEIMENDGTDIAVLCHQDMFFRRGWIDRMKWQVSKLPESWIVAGIIGKDMAGKMCGRLHDMRMPLHFSTDHAFPQEASCFDECCIIVNMKKGFRFDEGMPGFDLYGTLCVLQAEQMGGSAWILDAFAEHYCMRSFEWYPEEQFSECFKWLYNKFPKARRIDTTVLAVSDEAAEKEARDWLLRENYESVSN